MNNRYKVIQWATGITGQASLRAVIRNPNLELVAVKVYSPEKDGKDAGQIVGLENETTSRPIQVRLFKDRFLSSNVIYLLIHRLIY